MAEPECAVLSKQIVRALAVEGDIVARNRVVGLVINADLTNGIMQFRFGR